MTDKERDALHNRERAREMRPIVYAAATVRSSGNGKNASSEARSALEAFDQMFVTPPAEDA